MSLSHSMEAFGLAHWRRGWVAMTRLTWARTNAEYDRTTPKNDIDSEGENTRQTQNSNTRRGCGTDNHQTHGSRYTLQEKNH